MKRICENLCRKKGSKGEHSWNTVGTQGTKVNRGDIEGKDSMN